MLLQACNLTKQYGVSETRVGALQDISFEVADGEFVAIMGPSGSGKSTLLNIIGLLDRPTSGTVILAGERCTKLSSDRLAALRNQRIGFVFQSFNLLARSTTVENVEIPLVYARTAKRRRRQMAQAALETVGLSHRLKHWPSQLSGGEQQRVAIARALVNDPTIILADEPTGSLDSRQGLAILGLFEALNDAGRTVIIVTHDDYVARHAQRILKLRDGRLVSDEVVERRLRTATSKIGEKTPAIRQSKVAA